jgi:hypothetical protein
MIKTKSQGHYFRAKRLFHDILAFAQRLNNLLAPFLQPLFPYEISNALLASKINKFIE